MNFVCNEQNGRFVVTSKRTGKTYYVEPIGKPRTIWGDMDPATKKTTGSYGNKYQGSIDEKESVLTEENGFTNITYTGKGNSPFDRIAKMDAKYPTI
jgi:hypothetical protein